MTVGRTFVSFFVDPGPLEWLREWPWRWPGHVKLERGWHWFWLGPFTLQIVRAPR